MIERYTRSEMGKIWSLENRYRKFLEIEILAAEAWAELGEIPLEAARLIREKAKFSVDRIEELEKQTRHDIVAFTRCVAEHLDDEGRWFHYGLTSYDVVDTALSLMMQEGTALIRKGLKELMDALKEKALHHKMTPVMGRTHGIHAEPTSLGLKFALWLCETERNLSRLDRAAEEVRVGKLSGAVGNYAHINPFVEDYVCRKLGLQAAPVSTQIIQRDRHAGFISVLALTGASLEKIALEIRNQQRTEVGELEEPFYSGQKGSSAMPHKRNPVTCEQICGLARVLRSHAGTALENVALWHERDISHSSVERVIIPDSFILLDYLIHQAVRVTKGLRVYPENMVRNIEATGGLVYSQRLLLLLVDKGLSREEAYDLVQRCAMESHPRGKPFKELLWKEIAVKKSITREQFEQCLDPSHYLRRVDMIYRRIGLE